MRAELVALALVGALAMVPLAEAKGGSSSGRRNTACSPSDTNSDGTLSQAERDEQCGSSAADLWMMGLLALGVGGAALVAKLKKRGGGSPAWLKPGARGKLNGRIPVVVRGTVRYRDDEDSWEEHLLDLGGGAEAWLEVDGGATTLHKFVSQNGSIGPPPMAEGESVDVSEEGVMRLSGVSGNVPPDERPKGAVSYVDGRTPKLGRVSIEQDEFGLFVYRSFAAEVGKENEILVDEKALAKVMERGGA